MAKFVAAYIAEGSSRTFRPARTEIRAVDPHLAVAWKRLYCLFRFLTRFANPDDATRFILYTDHKPPQIDGMLIGHLLEQLGVEIVVSEFLWRSDATPERPDFFIFDALEQLKDRLEADDQLLLFGPEAMVVQDHAGLFRDLEAAGALAVEASVGEVSEALLTTYREEICNIRDALKSPCNPYGMLAANAHFLGFTGAKLDEALLSLKRLFPKNNLRATRGEYFLSEPSELLAAIMSDLNFHHPNLKALTDDVAAMPDELDILEMNKVPILVPGYGREPDIVALFERILPDATHEAGLIDPFIHLQLLSQRSRQSSWLDRTLSRLRLKPGLKRHRWSMSAASHHAL